MLSRLLECIFASNEKGAREYSERSSATYQEFRLASRLLGLRNQYSRIIPVPGP